MRRPSSASGGDDDSDNNGVSVTIINDADSSCSDGDVIVKVSGEDTNRNKNVIYE